MGTINSESLGNFFGISSARLVKIVVGLRGARAMPNLETQESK